MTNFKIFGIRLLKSDCISVFLQVICLLILQQQSHTKLSQRVVQRSLGQKLIRLTDTK